MFAPLFVAVSIFCALGAIVCADRHKHGIMLLWIAIGFAALMLATPLTLTDLGLGVALLVIVLIPAISLWVAFDKRRAARKGGAR